MNITRRDTLILAALCNVLVLLFFVVTGARGGASKKNATVEQVESPLEAPIAHTSFQGDDEPYAFDEIDMLLEEYVTVKPEEAPVAPKKEVRAQPTPPLRTYTVQKGDNPWIIAKKCAVSVETILRLNHLDAAGAKNLKIGQVLMVEPVPKQASSTEDDLNTTQTSQERFRGGF